MQVAALALPMIVAALVVLTHLSTQRPGDLDVALVPAEGGLRVAWLMPAGQAWYDGVRPGMRVLSIEGVPVARDARPPARRIAEAEFSAPDGTVLRSRVVVGKIARAPLTWTMWLLGATFAASGSLVALRRPDLRAAQLFALFCASSAFALVVAPSAGGPHARWALIVMFLGLLGVGAGLLAFVIALEPGRTSRRSTRLLFTTALALAAAYALAITARPASYAIVRSGMVVFLLLSVLVALALLGARSLRDGRTESGQQARIILFGVLLGTLPFVVLSLVPIALGKRPVMDESEAALFTAFIPAAAGFAIFHRQFLGIRRLLHRGMVYALTTTALFVAVVLLSWIVTPRLLPGSEPGGLNLFIGALVALCAALFQPLRLAARRLVDRLLYEDIDPAHLVRILRDDVVASTRADDWGTWIDRIARTLRVESALLFAAAEPGGGSRLLAAVGPRAAEVLEALGPTAAEADRDIVELHWGSDRLLVGQLRVADRRVGRLVLGPKQDGEVFMPVEKQLVATVAPILALALHKSELSGELGVLHRRLGDAEEAERARLASDVHDGPLQKAILLAGHTTRAADREELARELVQDLREVCSRLRPSILDDLGLVPALEWLLEDAAKRFRFSPHLVLEGVDESSRFPARTELTLFRVTQEAIHNAVKHAQPRTIEVALAREGGALTLRVEDDGSGFCIDSTPPGLGLPGMRGRVDRLGGTFDLRSMPGEGTTVKVRVQDVQA